MGGRRRDGHQRGWPMSPGEVRVGLHSRFQISVSPVVCHQPAWSLTVAEGLSAPSPPTLSAAELLKSSGTGSVALCAGIWSTLPSTVLAVSRTSFGQRSRRKAGWRYATSSGIVPRLFRHRAEGWAVSVLRISWLRRKRRANGERDPETIAAHSAAQLATFATAEAALY